MTTFTYTEMPSLIFSTNFDQYHKQINQLPYTVGSTKKTFGFSPIKQNYNPITLTFTEDLVVKKLCPKSTSKFSANSCAAATACTNSAACHDENKPIICNSNYIYDAYTSPNPSCVQTCSNKRGRSPMSTVDKSFCNRKCDSNMTKCESISSSETQNNYANNVCFTGYDRYGYKCIPQTTSKKSKFFLLFKLFI